MNKVELYASGDCPYCTKAKKLLDMLKLDYTEYNVDEDFDGMCEDLALRFGKQIRTVPQIVVNNYYIGGYTDLETIHKNGKLKEILK